MEIKNAVVFVTGANRGLGLAFAHELLERGARKVYAAARDPAAVAPAPGIVPVRLDVSDAAQVDAAAAGGREVLADQITRNVKEGLSAVHGVYLGPAD